MNTLQKTSILVLSLALAGSAGAVGTGFTVATGRDYRVSAKTGTVTAVALGRAAKADVNVAGIQTKGTDVRLGRGYRADIRTGSVTAVSLGFFGTGPINLGGIQTGN